MANPFDQYFDEPTTTNSNVNPFDQYFDAPEVKPQELQRSVEQPKTFTENLTDDWSNRVEKAKNSGLRTQGARSIYDVGQVLGGAWDVPMNLISTATPEYMKEGFKNVGEYYGNLAKPILDKIPEMPKWLGQGVETGLNIASVVPASFVANKLATRGTTEITKDIIAAQSADKLIDKAITKGVDKGIKPSTTVKNINDIKKYNASANSAIRDMVENSPTKLSQSENVLDDMVTQISNNKVKLWDDATAISKEAGKKGLLVDSQPVYTELEAIIKDPTAIKSGLADKASTVLGRWQKTSPKMTPQEAEGLLADLNNQSKAFWRGGDSEGSALSARLARTLKGQLSSTVDEAEKLGYQNFRNKYGAYSEIEEDVAKRSRRHAQLSENGYFDIVNAPTTMEFVRGVGKVLTGNVSGGMINLGSAASGMAMKVAMKKENDAANVIRQMFKDVEKHTETKKRVSMPPLKLDDMFSKALEAEELQANRQGWGGAAQSLRTEGAMKPKPLMIEGGDWQRVRATPVDGKPIDFMDVPFTSRPVPLIKGGNEQPLQIGYQGAMPEQPSAKALHRLKMPENPNEAYLHMLRNANVKKRYK